MIGREAQIEPADCEPQRRWPAKHPARVQYWRWAIAPRQRPIPVARTLPIADTVFGALTDACWALSGHRRLPVCLHGPKRPAAAATERGAAAAVPPRAWRHDHAFILPEDLDRDGFIDHICVAAAMGLDPAALRLLAATDRLTIDGHAIDLVAARMGPLRDFELVGGRVWISSTPYVPPNRRPTGPKDAAKQLRYEIARRQLAATLAAPPRPYSELRVGRCGLRPDGFDRTRADGERPPVESQYFFELTFTTPISGPLAFGWSCHRGLGQFVPVPATEGLESPPPSEFRPARIDSVMGGAEPRGMRLDIEVVRSAEEARALAEAGWCPVECSFGAESIVDELQMDHHGTHSHRESVAVRAYRDHHGARAADPRFVLTGVADADATFAIAALAGILTRAGATAEARGAAQAIDCSALAATVALVDGDPIGRDLPGLPEGETLLCWNTFFGGGRDRLAALAGVHGWRTLTTLGPERHAAFAAAARQADELRRRQAREEIKRRGRRIGRILLLLGTAAPAFELWYGRRPDCGASDEPAGWESPVVIAQAALGPVTIGCPNGAVAEALFGPGGLKAVYPRLLPPGWGGREAIGGAPRGLTLGAHEVIAAAETVAGVMGGNTRL